MGRFIVDFLCYEAKVIVEVDGDQHLKNQYDNRRDRWLRSQGFNVLRFSNQEVNFEIDAVMDTIVLTVEGEPS